MKITSLVPFVHICMEVCRTAGDSGRRWGTCWGVPAGDTVGVGAKWHNGQQWDFVFDVDFADNQAPKKLACNRGDNPYDVAERCAQQMLPCTLLCDIRVCNTPCPEKYTASAWRLASNNTQLQL